MKTFKIPLQTITGNDNVVASLPVSFGQSAIVKARARSAIDDTNGYFETVGLVRNGPGPVDATLTGLTPLQGGIGHVASNPHATTVTRRDGSAAPGTGLTVNLTVSSGVVTAIAVQAGGSRYSPGDIITVVDTQASVKATYQLQPEDVSTMELVGTPDEVGFHDLGGSPDLQLEVPTDLSLKEFRLVADAGGSATTIEGEYTVERVANTPV